MSRLIEASDEYPRAEDIPIPSIGGDRPGVLEEELAEIEQAQDADEVEYVDVDELTPDTLLQNFNSDMRPPPRPSNSDMAADDSEPILHKRGLGMIEDFVFALGLWCTKFRVSRRQYSSLVEVLQLMKDITDIKRLPKSVSTLTKSSTSQLPLIPQRRKKVALNPEKLPSIAESAKFDYGNSPPQAWVYWFDPIALISAILSSPKITANMHFGMAEFVDQPTEFWHSMSWASSVRSTSGQFAHYPDGSLIFPSDFVEYRCKAPGCTCNGASTHKGRIWAVGKDYTFQAAKQGGVTLLIQSLINATQARQDFDNGNLSIPIADEEIILREDSFDRVLEDDIFARIPDVFMDYNFETGIPNARNLPVSCKRIRRVANTKTKTIRPACLSYPPRAELELQAYGRNFFTSSNKNFTSVPMLCFADGFGLYRNTYRSLMGIYMALASMNLRQRSRQANVFSLTIGPHGSDFGDVITSVSGLSQLDKGVELVLDGKKTLLCAYILAFTGDMPQQQDNSGFKRQSATLGCRNCIIDQKNRGNLDFDTLHKGRYHHHTMQLRAYGRTLSASKYKSLCTTWGLAEKLTPLVKLTPALDIIRSRPADPAHSEYSGMAKQAQLLLVEAILTPEAQGQYAAELRRFPFPPGWGRLQSPIRHLKSWKMQEAGRAAIITPMLLRCWLKPAHVKDSFLQAVRSIFRVRSKEDATDIIIKFFAKLAKSISLVLSPVVRIEDSAVMHRLIVEARKMYQDICEAAATAVLSKPSRGNFTRHSSLAVSEADSLGSQANLEDLDDNASLAEFETSVDIPTSQKMKGKGNEYRKFKSRPNVHQGVHLVDLVSEYSTPNNANVLQQEGKHKYVAQMHVCSTVSLLCLIYIGNIRNWPR